MPHTHTNADINRNIYVSSDDDDEQHSAGGGVGRVQWWELSHLISLNYHRTELGETQVVREKINNAGHHLPTASRRSDVLLQTVILCVYVVCGRSSAGVLARLNPRRTILSPSPPLHLFCFALARASLVTERPSHCMPGWALFRGHFLLLLLLLLCFLLHFHSLVGAREQNKTTNHFSLLFNHNRITPNSAQQPAVGCSLPHNITQREIQHKT